MKRNDPLEDWLGTATAGLSRESKRRVALEIVEHYHSACDAGLDPESALAGLGDPKSARRAFRDVYLTSFQEDLVRNFRGLPPMWRRFVYPVLFVIGCGVALWGPETAPQRAAGLAMILILSASVTCLFLLVPRLYRRGRERIAIFLGAFSDFALYMAVIVGGSFVEGNLTTGKMAFFLAVLGTLLILYVPLLRKLRDRGPETPHSG